MKLNTCKSQIWIFSSHVNHCLALIQISSLKKKKTTADHIMQECVLFLIRSISHNRMWCRGEILVGITSNWQLVMMSSTHCHVSVFTLRHNDITISDVFSKYKGLTPWFVHNTIMHRCMAPCERWAGLPVDWRRLWIQIFVCNYSILELRK